jgi:hypothetical protein
MYYPFGTHVPVSVVNQGDFRRTLWVFYRNQHPQFAAAEACGSVYVAKTTADGSLRFIALNPDGGRSLACYRNKRPAQHIPVEPGDLVVAEIAFENDNFRMINIIANFGQIV